MCAVEAATTAAANGTSAEPKRFSMIGTLNAEAAG
jgi:hypothetical protein